jgi:2-hydroxy-6-oxo-6-(2'-carboxyphenyl)-hexa-2,4-dienoate hydrolase
VFLHEFGEKWVEVDGIRTRYFEAGSGEAPIVLVHGGTCGDASGGANAEDFERNFSVLARSHKVIAVDRLGQGYTDIPKSDSDYTMRASCRHFAGFLKALGKTSYHVVGHSRGGYVACRTTLDHPRLVASCIIIDSGTAAPGVSRNEIVFALNPHKPGTLESSRYVYEHYSWGKEHVTEQWLDMKQKITVLPKNKQAIAKMKDEGLLHSQFLPELLVDREEMFMLLERDGLRRPVLLFWGYNDPAAPLSQGIRLYSMLAKRQPRTFMHIVNHSGHHSFRERAEEFNRVVSEFVKGVERGD